jgi:hypothetical protein
LLGATHPNPGRTPMTVRPMFAVLVVLALMAVGCTSSSGGDDSTTTTQAAVTTTTQAPATTPATDSPSLSEWSMIPHDEAVFGGAGDQWMQSVTAGGPGLVAVGLDQTRHFGDGDAGEGHAAVWTSADGITWSRVPHDEAAFGGAGEEFMTSVTVGGPGLVAVGWDLGPTDADAAVWTSPDGITWSRAPHDEENLGAGQVTSVTSTGSMLVAVGNEGSDGGDDAAVWTSLDGITWSRVPHEEAVFGEAGMQSVTAGGPGLVAVGTSGPGDDHHAAVWTSVDGVHWSRVPHDKAVFGAAGGQVMESVAARGNIMVAVGTDGEDAAVWTSPDGIIWTRIRDDNAIFTSVGMSSATFGGSGVVAVGGDDGNAAAWNASTDD